MDLQHQAQWHRVEAHPFLSLCGFGHATIVWVWAAAHQWDQWVTTAGPAAGCGGGAPAGLVGVFIFLLL
jgi:hypothetical protein